MPPKIQPPSLKDISTRTMVLVLIHALLDEKHFDILRNYLTMTSYNILEMLQNEIMNILNLDASIRFNSLQVLLRHDVKQLKTGMFPRFYYDQILSIIIEKGKRLQKLNLKGVWARDYPQLLASIIDNLTELRSLEIPHMPDDTVISSINNLKYLTLLDISGEGGYTREGIKVLKSETLRILDIGSYGKKDLCFGTESNFELMADIIENLPNLSIIKTYSFTGHALHIVSQRNPHYISKLTYIYDTSTTPEIFDSIVNTCPLLDHAHFSIPADGVVEQFYRLKKLNSLKLTQGTKTEIVSFLQKSENRMEILQLNHNKDDTLDIGDFCRYAPNLRNLECFQMSLKFSHPEKLSLHRLQKVQILYCDISDKDVIALITNSPEVKSVTIGSSLSLTDDDIITLVTEHSFPQLEELVFSFAENLTVVSVEVLCAACPSLRVLGTISEWAVTEEEFIELKLSCQISNTDLTLLPVF
ncbi:uncharacterized protein LOC143195889 [Rhynchophorus ferrugineus]|uniref:uncharacterized protein LOC143195889 n=1 Tax=Rhynchophorus ferrugineus TaxID=354439 RepID=UPI003FCCE939